MSAGPVMVTGTIEEEEEEEEEEEVAAAEVISMKQISFKQDWKDFSAALTTREKSESSADRFKLKIVKRTKER